MDEPSLLSLGLLVLDPGAEVDEEIELSETVLDPHPSDGEDGI